MATPCAIQTVHQAYDEQAACTPNAAAVICRAQERQVFTYAEVCQRSISFAKGLAAVLGAQELSSRLADVVAICVPRTHGDFLPLLLAASRIGIPFVLLSTDLPDRALQDARSAFVIQALRPRVCLVASTQEAPQAAANEYGVPLITIDKLAAGDVGTSEDANLQRTTHSEILCYMFTGGTRRTKVVKATHAMVLHERKAYNELWHPPDGSEVKVLAHTSVYWAASALGQFSIALAFGGTAVCTDVNDIAGLRVVIAEEKIAILGLVPDHLDVLAPEYPAQDLPHVLLVFTWGEKLPARLVERWRTHPRATIRELLIATEYWLSLWSDPLQDSSLRIVLGTELLVRKEDGSAASEGELGELCIGGPMVMAGYHQIEGESENGSLTDTFHVSADGTSFFRTRDLVLRTASGVQFKGRSDFMTKHKGKWVDLLEVEEALARQRGVHAAKIVPDPSGARYHAFAEIRPGSAESPSWSSILALLPPQTQLLTVRELPRHPVTRKVDVTRLSKMVADVPVSWPIDVHLGDTAEAPPKLQNRLWKALSLHVAWTSFAIGAFGAATNSYDQTGVQMHCTFAVAALAAVHGNLQRNRPAYGPATLWMVTVLLSMLRNLRSRRGLIGLLALVGLPYAWLALVYAEANRSLTSIAGISNAILEEVPFRKLGLLCALVLGNHHLAEPFNGLCASLFGVLSLCGVHAAAQKRKLTSWPVFFYTVGLGQQAEMECMTWFRSNTWRWFMRLQGSRLRSMHKLLRLVVFPTQAPPVSDAPAIEANGMAAQEGPCGQCDGELEPKKWPARDDCGRLLCNDCALSLVSAKEARAKANLEALLANSSVDEAGYIDVAGLGGGSVSCAVESGESGFEVLLNDGWMRYPHSINEAIRNAQSQGHTEHTWEYYGYTYSIDLSSMVQVNVETGKQRTVRQYGAPPPSIQTTPDTWTQMRTRWWEKHYTDTIDYVGQSEEVRPRADCGAEPGAHSAENLSAEETMLCNVVGDIAPLLKPVHMNTVLAGLDSLRASRLLHAIKSQLGRTLSISQLRASSTLAELSKCLSEAESEQTGPTADGAGQEYAVWSTPGHNSAMGDWMIVTCGPLDRNAVIKATQQLVERHAAFRVQLLEPARYVRIVCDSATLFILVAPLMERHPVLRRFRQLLSWAFCSVWPRLRCYGREELYSKKHPGVGAPLEFGQEACQGSLELNLQRRSQELPMPGGVCAYELACHIVDVWGCYRHFRAQELIKTCHIMRPTEELKAKIGAGVDLIFIDASSGEWGPLVTPDNSRWVPAPRGFPAFFSVRMNSGRCVWVRLQEPDELQLCFTAGRHRAPPYESLFAYRVAPQRARDFHQPVVLGLVGFNLYHSVGDASCQMPLAQDFAAFYSAALGRAPAFQAPLRNVAFAELQQRLFDTLTLRPSPMRHSLRGCLFEHDGSGFSHSLHFTGEAEAAFARACLNYHIPFDIAMFGLIVCAQARADRSEVVDFTMFVPMRDGVGEAMQLGLFADWRDLSFNVDKEMATVLSTMMHVNFRIQNRHWAIFNSLRKPERSIVNVQVLDFEARNDFVPIGENYFRGGNQLHNQYQRGPLRQVRHPVQFSIYQEEKHSWWISLSVDYDKRPDSWVRAFVHSLQEAFHSFLTDGLALVHAPTPNDWHMLREAVGENGCGA